MAVAEQTRLKFILIFLFLLLINAGTAFAENECASFYGTPSDRLYAFDFLKKWRDDSLPFGAQRISRQKDKFDIYLLEQSYALGGIHRPIEMGLIELLDKKGNVLDYEVLTGKYKYVDGLNIAAINMLSRNSHQSDIIATVRKRHTHPKELHPTIIPQAFSDGDIRHDQDLRVYMNKFGYAHVRLEAWITYLNVDLTTHEPAELTFSDTKTRGYLVKQHKN